MSVKNQVQLITYVDRLSGGDLSMLGELLQQELKDLFSGVHLLPFYHPIDGEDAGFDPIDHTQVDTRLGNWQDVRRIGERFDIMADLIVNHMSAKSPQFQDVLANGQASPYWSLFLTRDKVFAAHDDALINKIYRPRPTPCFTDIQLKDGQTVPFWTTFTSNQIDIDVHSDAGQAYLNGILRTFADNNIDLIRLDAAGYAIKKAGTRCFMLEETFEFIATLSERAKQLGMQCLVEIHSHYQTQVDIAKRCDLVYDFALPPLVLHSLFSHDFTALGKWLAIAPHNCISVLDTHDGIGIIDAGPDGDKAGLLTPAQIDQLVETIHSNSAHQSRQATGAAASNVDLYQVNCTYYDALGQDDLAYLIARAIQFFSPGIPQVYYAGLLAIPNDMDLLSRSNVGRDINRPYLDREKVRAALQKPVVKALCQLIELRNRLTCFNGEFSAMAQGGCLTLNWQSATSSAKLHIDATNRLNASIAVTEAGDTQEINLADWLGV